MHNSSEGTALTTTGGATEFNGHIYFLIGSDQSSTCLNCHRSITDKTPTGEHVMSGAAGASGIPVEMTPGGDFAWLRITTSAIDEDGTRINNAGTDHGHNIVAADYGLTAAGGNLSTAPGGVYPSSNLHCSSCHDPHGTYRVNGSYQIVTSALSTNTGDIAGSGSYGTVLPTDTESVGVYRLLAGTGYLPPSLGGVAGAQFVNPPPFAFSPVSYNRAETSSDTRVAYGSGMSEWCANCHSALYNSNYPSKHEHPTGNNISAYLSSTDRTGMSIAQKYNAYVYSGNLTGNQQTSYTSMVPYEEGLNLNRTNYADLATRAVSDGSRRMGPSTGRENVMCLSCHRAHASGWPHALRWNADGGSFLTVQGVYPGVDAPSAEARKGQYNLGYTQAQVQKTFYDRNAGAYATYQRSLCNKCHASD